MSTNLQLYSAGHCPFALRTRIALREKGLAYTHIEIDLANKPADFLRVSPYAKVPVLLDGEARIYESAIINEYLDEKYPEPPLMPSTPEGRAYVRVWVDFAGENLFSNSWRMRRGPEEGRPAARAALEKHLARLQEELGDKTWLAGDAFTLADIATLPVFALLSALSDFDLGAFPKLDAWWKRASARPAYVATGGLGQPVRTT